MDQSECWDFDVSEFLDAEKRINQRVGNQFKPAHTSSTITPVPPSIILRPAVSTVRPAVSTVRPADGVYSTWAGHTTTTLYLLLRPTLNNN